MQAGQWEILPGMKTDSVGFNGPYLGPTIRFREGQDVHLSYTNHWSESVAVHGHGLHVSGALDGGPQRLIEPGDTWSPVLPIRQQAGTAWYHPHTHGRSGSQTYKGLAGMLLIEDDNSVELPLPRTYGVDDIPLIVQDRRLDSQSQLAYSLQNADREGFLGDFVTVNGIAGAEANVPAGLVRLRILNGSNARFYRFRFADGRVFHKIATEGGFLPEPVPIQDLVMLPGERNEILVDCTDGTPAELISGPSLSRGETRGARRDNERSDGDQSRSNGLSDTFEIVTLRPDPRLPPVRTELPRQLNVIERPSIRAEWPRRIFRLNMEVRRDERRRSNRSQDRERRPSTITTDNHEQTMGINRQPMDMRVINERVHLGQWELWQVEADRRPHPFHVHGCSFLVLEQGGEQVSDADAGWKDTVSVSEDTRTTFIVRFDHPATDEFPYMYHCHILEHEDMGMMGQFTVT